MKRTISKLIDTAAIFVVLALVWAQSVFGRDRRYD